ncbi:recombinase family protein [Amycolatopsis minnesotensis]|uniref:Recombinase family protein n=1 Tax=Amycolatopsis minnesotensis TaxID=337894 RepID=A0ABN2SEN7_9PSEU
MESHELLNALDLLARLSKNPLKKRAPLDPDTLKLGVEYLRVSSKKQLKGRGAEGNSIPTQRKTNSQCAEKHGIKLVKSFTEPGQSGLTIQDRPEFQELIKWLIAHPEVKYVIVYTMSRAMRNVPEESVIKLILGEIGVTVISSTEELGDETKPTGRLLHGVMSLLNQFYSEASGEDIRTKMAYKAKTGGTLGIAKLGYLNHAATAEDGHKFNTIITDPDRADHIREAFELYATGRYTEEDIRGILTERGLTTRPTTKRPAKPVSLNKISLLLRDRYYCGYVTFDGLEYKGLHEPLIDEELFDRVQEVRATRYTNNSRRRVYHHPLKGELACHRCGGHLILTQANGNGGGYLYYFCTNRARAKTLCTLPYLRVDGPHGIDKAVITHLGAVAIPDDLRPTIAQRLNEIATTRTPKTEDTRATLTTKLAQLDQEEDRLFQTMGDPDFDQDKAKANMRRVRIEQAATTRKLAQLDTDQLDEETTREVFTTALDLLTHPAQAYEHGTDNTRALIISTIYTKLYIDQDDNDTTTVSNTDETEPFDTIRAVTNTHTTNKIPRQHTKKGATQADDALRVSGSSHYPSVEVPGIEPGSSGASSRLLRAQSAVSLLDPVGHTNKPT